MKKILATILVFLGLLTIGASIGVHAEDSSFKVSFLSNSVDGTSGLSPEAVKKQLDTSATTMVDEVSAFAPSDKVYSGKTGLKFGSSKVTGTMDVTFKQAYNVTKIVIFAAKYGSDSSKISINNGAFEGEITSSSPQEFTYTLTAATSLDKVNFAITGKRGYLKSFEVFYSSEAATTYNITFDANGGALKEDKNIMDIPLEQSKEVTLPTAADLEKTPYANQTILSGWTAAGKSYEPGASVSVSSATRFVAVYVAPDRPISMADAILICKEVGSYKTDLMFSVEGKIKEIKEESSGDISVFITDGTNEMEAYRLTNATNLSVGDTIIVTGKLTTYKSTYEFDANCTFELVEKTAEEFVLSQTVSSLIVRYDANLQPTDVDLRFGAKISKQAYNSNAAYGVLVVKKADAVAFTAGATTYATADEFIAANTSVKKMVCTPEAVNDGYQFAWVINDMEGNYNTDLVAVVYMEYNGVLYLGVSLEDSVVKKAEYYFDNSTLYGLTEEQLEVLANI